jgi:DNA mismatch repair ATPase MutS
LLATNTNLCLFVTHYPLLLNLASVYPAAKNVHLAVNVSSGGKLHSYRHQVTAGASVLATDYGIDLAERMGVSAVVLARARAVKVKIIEAAPPGVDEQRTGGDLGRLAQMIKQLLRRLSSLKGASIDDKTLRSYLDKLKAQLTPEQTARLRQALQTDGPSGGGTPAMSGAGHNFHGASESSTVATAMAEDV